MKKLLILLLVFCSFHLSFSQDILTPNESFTFGSNTHTNRDQVYFSHIDSEGNTIIIGTTENDESFTDIIVIKLDENLNDIWKQEYSVPTNQSYDIPLKSFITDTNDIVVVGLSNLDQSTSSGLLFAIKLNTDGTFDFNTILGNIDGSDYVNYQYFQAGYNHTDDSLQLVYDPNEMDGPEVPEYHFVTLDSQGTITDSAVRTVEGFNVAAILKDGKYMFFTQQFVDPDDFLQGFISTFLMYDASGLVSEFVLDAPGFNEFYEFFPFINDKIQLNVVGNDLFIVHANEEYAQVADRMNITKINVDTGLVYSVTSDGTERYSEIYGTFIKDGNVVAVANQLDNNSVDFLSVDDSNALTTLSSINNLTATGFKNQDELFFLTTSNSNIRLYKKDDFQQVNSFSTSNSYSLVDFNRVSDNTIVSYGTRLDKMFPESEFFTQNDIISEKITTSGVETSYSFSGDGTSRMFRQEVLYDHNNDIYILTHEQVGPECLFLTCGNAPSTKAIRKYDANYNLLWEIDMTDQLYFLNGVWGNTSYHFDSDNNLYFNLAKNSSTSNEPTFELYKISSTGEIVYTKDSSRSVQALLNENTNQIAFVSDYHHEDIINSNVMHTTVTYHNLETGEIDETFNIQHQEIFQALLLNDQFYFFLIDNCTDSNHDNMQQKMYIYNDDTLLYERTLDVDTDSCARNPNVDTDGNIYFFTGSYLNNYKLNKLSIQNDYVSTNSQNDRFHSMVRLENGKFYVLSRDYYLRLYDENFNLLNTSSEALPEAPRMTTKDNILYYSVPWANSIEVFDDNLNSMNQFGLRFKTNSWDLQFDRNGNLIVYGNYGDRILTFNEFGWFRLFIDKYTMRNVLSDDSNLTLNSVQNISVYPNPTFDEFHITGFDDQDIVKTDVYNSLGKKVRSTYSKTGNLSGLAEGIYFIKIFTTNNQVINKKVIKR